MEIGDLIENVKLINKLSVITNREVVIIKKNLRKVTNTIFINYNRVL